MGAPHRRHLPASQPEELLGLEEPLGPEEPLGLEEPLEVEVQLLDQQVVAANAAVLYQQLYINVIPGPSP